MAVIDSDRLVLNDSDVVVSRKSDGATAIDSARALAAARADIVSGREKEDDKKTIFGLLLAVVAAATVVVAVVIALVVTATAAREEMYQKEAETVDHGQAKARGGGNEQMSNACKSSGTHGGGAQASGKETRRYGVGRGDPGGRRRGHEERTDGCKDSGANGGGTEVSGDETRRC